MAVVTTQCAGFPSVGAPVEVLPDVVLGLAGVFFLPELDDLFDDDDEEDDEPDVGVANGSPGSVSARNTEVTGCSACALVSMMPPVQPCACLMTSLVMSASGQARHWLSAANAVSSSRVVSCRELR